MVKSVSTLLELTITAKRTITNENSDDEEETYDLHATIRQRAPSRLQPPSLKLKLESSATHRVKIEKNDKNPEEKIKTLFGIDRTRKK